MSEKVIVPREDPRQTSDDAPAVTHVIPAEEVKQLCATMRDVAKDLTDKKLSLDEASERSARILADIEKAQKLSVPVKPSDPGPNGRVSMDRLMARRSHDPEIVEMQQLADRALARTLIRAGRSGQMPLEHIGEGQTAAKLSALPREIMVQTPEYLELRDRMVRLAAGSHIDTSTATSGAEWVPTGFSRQAVDFYFVDSALEAALEQQLIPENVGNFSIPIESSRSQAVIEAQQTAASANYINTGVILTPLTDTIDFTPKKLGYGWQWSMEANEDLAVDTLSLALRKCPEGIRRGVRQAIINGQTASDATLDDAPAVSGLNTADGWSNAGGDNSLRLHCIVNAFTTALGAAMTFADIMTARKAMGKFGLRPNELALTSGPAAMIGLFSDDTHVTTLEKMGPMATVLTGQLGSCGGVPLFPDSEFLDTLDAGGINAGTGAVGGAVLFNRTRWYLATKRTIQTYVIPGMGMDNMTVISRWRGDSKIAVVDEHSAHYLINLT